MGRAIISFNWGRLDGSRLSMLRMSCRSSGLYRSEIGANVPLMIFRTRAGRFYRNEIKASHSEATRLCRLLLYFVIIEHKCWYFTEHFYILLNEGSPYSSLKSSLQAGQLIEHTAQSPDVTLLVVGLSFTQLWRNVAWGPNHLSEKK